jgi:hypothetical protein
MLHHDLKNGFQRACVPLRLEAKPFVSRVRTRSIVQLDVDRSRGGEAIRLFPGKGAELSVPGVDEDLRQLILRVQEPARAFKQREWDAKKREHVWVERWTSDVVRRFLVGEDESHLFVAQLTLPADSVAEAHRTLRPRELGGRKNVVRQGEWFFVPLTRDERGLLAKALRAGAAKQRGLGAHLAMRGRRHVVDELVQLRQGARIIELVRGRVRHPDHEVLRLEDWHRVVMNTEDRSVGATWVD